MLCQGSLDQKVGHQASVRQLVPSDRRQTAVLQPELNGSALVCVSISCNHWVIHCHLHAYSSNRCYCHSLLYKADSIKNSLGPAVRDSTLCAGYCSRLCQQS